MTTKQTQSLDTQVALLQQFNIDVVRPFIDGQSIASKAILDKIENSNYLPRPEFIEFKTELETEMADLRKDVRKRDWKQNTLSATAGIVGTLLVTYVVMDLISK